MEAKALLSHQAPLCFHQVEVALNKVTVGAQVTRRRTPKFKLAVN